MGVNARGPAVRGTALTTVLYSSAMKVTLRSEDLLSMTDLSPGEVGALVARARDLKYGASPTLLTGKTLVLLFERPSLRTRVCLEVAMSHLGGHSTTLQQAEVGLGVRETIADVARSLSRWVQGGGLACRTGAHSGLEELARHASVPVINALSDQEHPTQALADLMTIQECHGELAETTIAFIGDGNNVASSLALGAMSVGATLRIASPEGYQLPQAVADRAASIAQETGGRLELLHDPKQAVRNAHVVYTDVWTSMGNEAEADVRRQAFAGYQVDADLLDMARPGVTFMHDMPVHYGEEVPAGFLEHPQSVAYQQAENRLHTLKAVLEAFLG